ncbi:FlgM family anti-sigma-28 factor [Azonexus fungiphilus]|jgi:negative regulator of flagellin synthesis FlgM|uniref:Negative regulator of flagellin synthesis n=1 Tax=Azonexus fungiphilus TaxID=146940 RepID=A0A495VPW2_9RHOO|nr:flagellar biosynthesis anti-sigma factor FlgM [Azonexus fungiphilus]RKT50395.1 FlgM family anti-sigma-28 factor [Azonexus fungiphilus]
MKIDNSTFKAPPLRPTSTPQRAPENTSQAAESVSLSSSAAPLQKAETPPVNATKIKEIKDAIAQGRFQINPEAIADGLLETARDLVNSQRQA